MRGVNQEPQAAPAQAQAEARGRHCVRRRAPRDDRQGERVAVRATDAREEEGLPRGRCGRGAGGGFAGSSRRASQGQSSRGQSRRPSLRGRRDAQGVGPGMESARSACSTFIGGILREAPRDRQRSAQREKIRKGGCWPLLCLCVFYIGYIDDKTKKLFYF